MLMLNWKRRITAVYSGLAIMVAFFTPIVHAGGNPSIYDAIVEAGLTTNLKLVLDAGDSQSYDGTSQKWLDRSGGGYDFFLGTNGTIQSTDPTFNGTAGRLTSSEFFSVDGGDYFSYDTSIETWMQNIGKNNGIFSMIAVLYIPSGTTFPILSNRGAAAGSFGMSVSYNDAAPGLQLSYIDSGGSLVTAGAASPVISAPGVFIVGFSTQFNGTASTYDMFVNGTGNTSGAAGVTATSSNPANNLKLLSRGDASVPAPNGTRLYGLAAWEGTRLTQANFTTLWSRLRSRFGL